MRRKICDNTQYYWRATVSARLTVSPASHSSVSRSSFHSRSESKTPSLPSSLNPSVPGVEHMRGVLPNKPGPHCRRDRPIEPSTWKQWILPQALFFSPASGRCSPTVRPDLLHTPRWGPEITRYGWELPLAAIPGEQPAVLRSPPLDAASTLPLARIGTVLPHGWT